MTAATCTVISRAPQRAKRAAQIVGAAVALGMATGCMTDDSGRPTNQATGTLVGAALGSTVGGLAFGSVGGAIGGALVGALAGNLVGRALDDQERRRLAEATRRAYASETDEPIVYTVEPTKTSQSEQPAQPTIVAAKPVGPKASRADGSSCRPIELTATKNGQTTRDVTTFCQTPGSTELKPISV